MMGVIAIGRSRRHAMDFLIGLDALCLVIIRNILNEGDAVHNAHHLFAAAYVKNGNVMTAAVVLQILDGDDGFQAIPPNGTGFFALYWFIRL